MTAPRGLSDDEAAAWEKLAATVVPLHPVARRSAPPEAAGAVERPVAATPRKTRTPRVSANRPAPPPAPVTPGNLDSHWDRRLKSGALQPELTLDLHGHNLDQAYDRLMSGLAQARGMGARTILLIAGNPRPVDAADRAGARGAIRAKVLDWLAASEHHQAIAAVRRAHIRHGGEGALYIVLRRER